MKDIIIRNLGLDKEIAYKASFRGFTTDKDLIAFLDEKKIEYEEFTDCILIGRL